MKYDKLLSLHIFIHGNFFIFTGINLFFRQLGNLNSSNHFILKTENFEIKTGDVINHETLGTGVVVAMNGDLIDVAFKTGIKKLMKSHKSISKV